MSYSTSFQDEEGLPSVVGGKIIKAGSYCRIICHFSFHKVAAVAVYSSYWWKRLLEKCFDGFQMQCSFQILIQSYPNEFIGLCKWKQANLNHNIWQLFAVALICAYFSICARFWMLRKTFECTQFSVYLGLNYTFNDAFLCWLFFFHFRPQSQPHVLCVFFTWEASWKYYFLFAVFCYRDTKTRLKGRDY